METGYKSENIKISETIRALRQNKGINQEVLAEALSVSTQAVSKWETGASVPDVMMLPRIAGYFGVTTDHIYFGGEMPIEKAPAEIPAAAPLFPDDGVFRVVQFMGGKMLSAEEASEKRAIELTLNKAAEFAHDSGKEIVIPTEIYGPAVIHGSVNGDVRAQGDLVCGTVNGNAGAEGDLDCGTVNGGAAAGKDLKCTTVNGNIQAAGNVTAEKVVGCITAAGSFFGGENTGRQEQDRQAERAERRAERRGLDSFGREFGREMGRFGREIGRAFSFGRKQRTVDIEDLPFPDDGVLRVVQFIGSKPTVWREGYCLDPIPLEIETAAQNTGRYRVDILVYGSADIKGDISGNVTAEGDVSCQAVEGSIAAEGDVSAVSVGGNVTAEGEVSCNNVNGSITAEGGITCGNVGGNISTEGDVECADVSGNVCCEGDLSCNDILGDVKSCEGDIECRSIGGSVHCEGDIQMG